MMMMMMMMMMMIIKVAFCLGSGLWFD